MASKRSFEEIIEDGYICEVETMEDYILVKQIETIGPKRVKKNQVEDYLHSQEERNLQFVKNFTIKECVKYVHDAETEEDYCYCGAKKKKHVNREQVYRESNTEIRVPPTHPCQVDNESQSADINIEHESWSEDTCIEEFPINAFGKIYFNNENSGSIKPAKYIRISDTSDVQKVLSLMIEFWKLNEPQKPNLCISIIGGHDKFELDDKRKNIFSFGLLKAIKSTNAWLITDGINVGITKVVGELVNKEQDIVQTSSNRLDVGIKCISVVPFGQIRKYNSFVNLNPTKFHDVSYTTRDDYRSLNGDHTHFIMIDDGYRNKKSQCQSFRTRIEEKIQDPSGLGIPIVQLLINGGMRSITSLLSSLQKGIPAVVLKGSGRAADILSTTVTCVGDAYIKKEQERKKYGRKIRHQMNSLMKDITLPDQEIFANKILDCCVHRDLITIFDIDSFEDMDKYILNALLTGSDYRGIEQLNLALSWNRPDIAEMEIFSSNYHWMQSELEATMTTALLEEKVDFVRLLLNYGVVITDYLTVEKLGTLYYEASKTDVVLENLLKIYSKTNYSYLIYVQKLLRKLLRNHVHLNYELDFPDNKETLVRNKTFTDPYHEILLWSVLSQRHDLAMFAWERCNSPVIAAITAACIYHKMCYIIDIRDSDHRERFKQYKEQYELLAVKLLDICCNASPVKAISLVEKKHSQWGNINSLELAESCDCMKFISSPCCQKTVDLNWKRGMIRAPTLGVILTNIFPCIILFSTIIQFQKLEGERSMSIWNKVKVFYNSPISRFFMHSLFYILFLILYAYFIMFDFYSTPIEIVVNLWMLSFILMDLGEIISKTNLTFFDKVKDWWKSFWNKLDAISYVLAIVALSLRFFEDYSNWSRIIYSVNTTILFSNLFRNYQVSYRLGPKVIIIFRMITEVGLFMAVMVIVILGYGIASQALLHPPLPDTSTKMTFSTLVQEVLFVPYWQMFGELLLDRIQENSGTLTGENYNAWVLYLMLIFYLIVGNIMLLNLLIAIFTHIFEEVQEHSIEYWKFEMYKIVKEYDNKALLPPPFTLLEYVFTLFSYLTIMSSRTSNVDYERTDVKNKFMVFEKHAVDVHLAKNKKLHYESVDYRLRRIEEKIDRLVNFREQESNEKKLKQELAYLELVSDDSTSYDDDD